MDPVCSQIKRNKRIISHSFAFALFQLSALLKSNKSISFSLADFLFVFFISHRKDF